MPASLECPARAQINIQLCGAPQGNERICTQFDHHSIWAVVMLIFAGRLMAAAEYVVLPIQGYLLVFMGKAVDASDYAMSMVRSLWGKTV